MKRFWFYLLLTSLLVISVDLLGRIFLNIVINNIPDNTSHLSKVYKSLSIDSVGFIVVGMSTAEHNYNIEIIENSLQMSGYNCGSDGRNIYYDHMVVRNAVEKCKTLQMVIVDISRATLTNETKDRINIVYPFYWVNPIVREETKVLKGKKMDILMMSSLYQLNSGLQNVWRLFHPLAFKEYHGFSPYPYTDKIINTDSLNSVIKEPDVDEEVVDCLKKILVECKSNNITVILVKSPSLIRDRGTSIWLSEFATKHKVDYMDLSSCNQIVSNTKLFKDEHHLNEWGAQIFSKIIAERIKYKMKKYEE